MFEKYLKFSQTKLSSSNPPLRLKTNSFVFKRKLGVDYHISYKFIDKERHKLTKKVKRVKLTASSLMRKLLKEPYIKREPVNIRMHKNIRTPLKLHKSKDIFTIAKEPKKQTTSLDKLIGIAKSRIKNINNTLKCKMLLYKNTGNSRNGPISIYATNIDRNGYKADKKDLYSTEDNKTQILKNEPVADKDESDDCYVEYSCRTVIEHECDNDYSLMCNGLNETFLANH